MATPRVGLRGSRRWLPLASLTLAAGALVGTQVHTTAAHADLSPVAATSAVSPSVVDSRSAGLRGATPAQPPAPVAAVAPAVPAGPVAAAPLVDAAPRPPALSGSDVCSGPDWSARRSQNALATLKDNGSRSGVTVTFLGPKPGYLGLTYPSQHHVDVFVRSCSAESAALLRHVVSHEMGHAYDAAHMTPALRAAYLAMRGIPAGTPWFGCSYCTDFATPAGDFAETYSQWQRGSHDSRTQMAPMPDATQLAAIAAAFFGG